MVAFPKMPFGNDGSRSGSFHRHSNDGYDSPYKPKYTMTVEKSEPTTRKRIPIACGRCRKRKIRCSGDDGTGAPCTNCQAANHSPCQFLRVSATETTMRMDGVTLRDATLFNYNLNSARRFQMSPTANGDNDYHDTDMPPPPYEASTTWQSDSFEYGRVADNKLSFQVHPYALTSPSMPGFYLPTYPRFSPGIYRRPGIQPPQSTAELAHRPVSDDHVRTWATAGAGSPQQDTTVADSVSTPRRGSAGVWGNASLSPGLASQAISSSSNYAGYDTSPAPAYQPMPGSTMAPSTAAYATVANMEPCSYAAYTDQAAVAAAAIAATTPPPTTPRTSSGNILREEDVKQECNDEDEYDSA